MRLIAIRADVVDAPMEAHKTHKKPVPYLGGVAIVIGVTSVSFGASLFSNFSKSTFWLASSVLFPAVIMGIVGLIDDLKKLSPWSRFVVQNLVALFSTFILVLTKTVGSPSGSIFLDIAVTVLWIVGLANAVNFFDNVDGGASGTIAISAFFLFILTVQQGQVLIGALSIVLAGATLGFLLWNRPPARIYMGDAGALFLGVLIASLTVRFDPNPLNKWASFSIPFLLLAMPIMDTTVVVVSRIVRGVSPFQGGRDHLSHRLIQLGLNKRQSVLLLWLTSFFFSSIGLIISFSPFALEGLIAFFGLIFWILLFTFFYRLPSLN
jgi:UDP-GlcNAc:undecaprenyl-phosphate GlcNAc-1-phosphate transferase